MQKHKVLGCFVTAACLFALISCKKDDANSSSEVKQASKSATTNANHDPLDKLLDTITKSEDWDEIIQKRMRLVQERMMALDKLGAASIPANLKKDFLLGDTFTFMQNIVNRYKDKTAKDDNYDKAIKVLHFMALQIATHPEIEGKFVLEKDKNGEFVKDKNGEFVTVKDKNGKPILESDAIKDVIDQIANNDKTLDLDGNGPGGTYDNLPNFDNKNLKLPKEYKKYHDQILKLTKLMMYDTIKFDHFLSKTNIDPNDITIITNELNQNGNNSIELERYSKHIMSEIKNTKEYNKLAVFEQSTEHLKRNILAMNLFYDLVNKINTEEPPVTPPEPPVTTTNNQQTKIIYGDEYDGWNVDGVNLGCNRTQKNIACTTANLIIYGSIRDDSKKLTNNFLCQLNIFDTQKKGLTDEDYNKAAKKVINGEVILFNMDKNDPTISSDDKFIYYSFVSIEIGAKTEPNWESRFRDDVLPKIEKNGDSSYIKNLDSIDIKLPKVFKDDDKFWWNKDFCIQN